MTRVSASAKAILDLPRTREHLETPGVLVIGYRTSELPAFYSRTSGLALDHRADSAAELAAIARCRWDDLGGGILVANPIPEAAAIYGLDAAIDAAPRCRLSAPGAVRPRRRRAPNSEIRYDLDPD